MSVNISRVRYMIMDDTNRVLCGYGKNSKFVSINNLGNAPIRTYESRKKAIPVVAVSEEAFVMLGYQAIPVQESFIQIGE